MNLAETGGGGGGSSSGSSNSANSNSSSNNSSGGGSSSGRSSVSNISVSTAAYVPNVVLTKTLSIGSEDSEVTTLQKFLINQGYLPTTASLGYYGPLTKLAVQKYQCAQKIACSGNEATTGYGMVGKLTRNVIASNATAVTTSTTQPDKVALMQLLLSLLKQLAVLQAKLKAMQASGL